MENHILSSHLSSGSPRVQVTSDFWCRYRDLIVERVLPYMWDVMNDTNKVEIPSDPAGNTFEQSQSKVIENLTIAAGESTGHFYGYPFRDSDAYKWLEAAAYALRYREDENLKAIADGLIDLIGRAQDDDGYLVTLFQIDMPERRFARLQQSHELYTMGHYIEAAIAYHATTGNTKALAIAQKMADCIDANFGPENGKIHGVDGHPEIEIALPKLYEVTGDKRYLDLADYFISIRGQNPDFFEQQNDADGGRDNDLLDMSKLPKSYYMVDKPLEEQVNANGHAVRVVYMCTAMAHVAQLTRDEKLFAACKRLWSDIVRKRMYITGAAGSTHVGESFTFDYDLPNDTMYGESCASVGMVFFADRMLALDHKGEYGDVIEKELFNGVISGMSLDGEHFFYVNPLEADPAATAGDPGKRHVLTHRAEWFGCPCCPSNIARLVASVDRYIYSVCDDVIYSHQFIANHAEFECDSGVITVEQHNDFPTTGHISYTVTNPSNARFAFAIRIPSWSADFTIALDGVEKDEESVEVIDGFAFIPVANSALTIDLDVDLTPRMMRASNRIREDIGKVAIMRGPSVYCAEEVDNRAPLWLYSLPVDAVISTAPAIDELPGVVALRVEATREVEDCDGIEPYRPVARGEIDKTREKTFLTLIPYYAWANRAEGQMQVWHRMG